MSTFPSSSASGPVCSAVREFDLKAHRRAAAVARDAYGVGKQRGGSGLGYQLANRAYREVYEATSGVAFEWFEGFPGIWERDSSEAQEEVSDDGIPF